MNAISDVKVKKPRISKVSKFVADPANVGCDFCPIKESWSELVTPQMPISGNIIDPDILVLAEAPGKTEDIEGKALVGASGKVLRRELPSKHLHRLAFQNAVRCRPDSSNRTPTPAEVHACSVYLESDVENLPIKAILGTGNVPLHKFFPEAQILKIHGTKFPVKLGNKVVWYYPVFHPSYVLRSEQENGGGKVRPVFENDIKRFFREVDKWEEPEIIPLLPESVIVPRSREEAQNLVDRMCGPIAVDVETTDGRNNKEVPRSYAYGARLLTASFSDGKITISFAVNHPEYENPWGWDFLLTNVKTRRWIAHNANYELTWFRQADEQGDYSNFDDTMALARLYHQRETLLSLEILSMIHLGVNVKKVVNVNAAKINTYKLEQVLQYNGLDTMATAHIYHKLHDKVDRAGYNRFIQAIDATTGMELMGLPINLETAQQLKKQWSDIVAQKENDVHNFVEIESYVRDTGTEFSISSPRQLAKVLDTYTDIQLPQTDKGNLSTSKKVLADVADKNGLVRTILDYREATKLMSTYIDAVLEVPNLYPDGRLHPNYTVLHTATARLSSTNPNCQNFPRRQNSETRNMIEVPEGSAMLAFDYAQLEARVLAMASRCAALCKSIINGRDIHSDWRDNLLSIFPDYIDIVMQREKVDPNVDEETLLQILRDRVKNQFVFASFYGAAPFSCSQSMGLPITVLEELAIELWKEFPGVKKWLKEKRNEYQETGEMLTLTGRVRYQILYKSNEVVNTPIQGTAADIVSEAMNELMMLSRQKQDNYLHPRIQIHDDLTFIVPEKDVEYYVDVIHPVLTKVRFPFQTVPLAVEAKIGTKWAELEKFAVFTGEYIK